MAVLEVDRQESVIRQAPVQVELRLHKHKHRLLLQLMERNLDLTEQQVELIGIQVVVVVREAMALILQQLVARGDRMQFWVLPTHGLAAEAVLAGVE
jgi:hypothetical protein